MGKNEQKIRTKNLKWEGALNGSQSPLGIFDFPETT